MTIAESQINNEQLWYKDAVIYQLHVKTFFDSNGDGIGDFKGLTQKLDYIKNLGTTAIWLLPFYPSPLRDDGYDIADYQKIHPDYGTLKDFKEFLRQAHKRDLKVITELVINHTSDQHPWFKRAAEAAPGSNHRNYYVWSDTPEKYKEARIIFTDFEVSNWTWNHTAKSYYWHRFYAHQPDLNFDNPNVQKEIMKIADYWFDMGVDGLRLDAVPYLFEREDTNCENLPETYEFLRKFRKHVDSKYKNKMLLAEANQWPEDAVKYFGDGDICHMAFHFPLMPRLYMAVQMEDKYPVIDILEQTPDVPGNCQWAIFLRNHDELTLEMVTDEERDYMYKMYAQDSRAKINVGIRRRLIPLLNNDRKKIELMYMLLFTMPGAPIIYYGDEIGMGDNYYLGDRNGVRTPMQWESDKNAGFSKANPQQLYLPVIIDTEYHYETVNVGNQERNLSSLLWWIRRVIAMRKNYKSFSSGSMSFLPSENPRVLSFIRQYENERILCVFNLSRFFQSIKLDLSEYVDYIPEELYSQNKCPVIKKSPYHITLGPHSYYLLSLKKEKGQDFQSRKDDLPELKVNYLEENWLAPGLIKNLEENILPVYLVNCRWFGGKSRGVDKIGIVEKIALDENHQSFFLVLSVKYRSAPTNYYALPLSLVKDPVHISRVMNEFPESIITRISSPERQGILFDGAYDRQVHKKLLELISRRKKLKGSNGELVGFKGKKFKSLLTDQPADLASHVLKAEQSNTSILYGETFFMKLFRRFEEGINSDTEIIRYLTEEKRLSNVPQYAGSIEYHRKDTPATSLCLLQSFTQNQGDAWTYTLDHIRGYFDHLLSIRKEINRGAQIPESYMDVDESGLPDILRRTVSGSFIEMIKVLGQRTGELHLALAKDGRNKDFAPEGFSMLYQRSLYQSVWSRSRKVWNLFRKNIRKVPEGLKPKAKLIIESENEAQAYLKKVTNRKFSALKIRIHGDYHLGQVLFTGKDFVIIDFEGEPAVGLSERRLKRSALRDIAGMVRSFHYAAYSVLLLKPGFQVGDITFLEKWAAIWYQYISGLFIKSYRSAIRSGQFAPKNKDEFELLLNFFMLDKAIYELSYEIDNRPDWMLIPMEGIMNILGLSLPENVEN